MAGVGGQIGLCFKYGLGIWEFKAKEQSRGGLGDSADGKLRKNGVMGHEGTWGKLISNSSPEGKPG